METERSPTEDDRATEPPAEDEPEQDRSEGKERQGGPYGNPALDEEALRKKQEEARRRGEEHGG
jgi:hypothetical protein